MDKKNHINTWNIQIYWKFECFTCKGDTKCINANKSLWNQFNAIFLFNSCNLFTFSHRNSNDSLISRFIWLLFPRIDISCVSRVKGTPSLHSTLFQIFKEVGQILFSTHYKSHSSNKLRLNCELIESRKYSQRVRKV
jgi:hypothetical protein